LDRGRRSNGADTALRFGLIGCGGIGELRAEALTKTNSHRIVALSDLDESRARALSLRYGGDVERNWRSLVQREDVDAVIVSTPPSLHAEMSIEALQSGKHVICEKPLARTPDECRMMTAAAKRSGRFLATGFNYRFYPSILKARALLDSGIIGELDHIRSYAGYTAAEHNPAWVHDADIMGGGALRDNGIHLIDLTRYFLGEVEEVKGFASNSAWNFKGCEDNGFALLRSPKGVIATLQASWTEWRGYRFLIELYGSLGCIRTWCFPMMTQVLWTTKRGGRPRKQTYLFPKTFLFEHLKTYRWVVTQSFIVELHGFTEAIQGCRTQIADGMDGLRAVEIADKICRNSSLRIH